MKTFVFAVLLVFCRSSFGSEFVGYFRNDAHPGKCVFGDLILSPGDKVKPLGRCEQLFCDGVDGFGTVQSCGVGSVEPPCELGEFINIDAPYPECCIQRIICPEAVTSVDPTI